MILTDRDRISHLERAIEYLRADLEALREDRLADARPIQFKRVRRALGGVAVSPQSVACAMLLAAQPERMFSTYQIVKEISEDPESLIDWKRSAAVALSRLRRAMERAGFPGAIGNHYAKGWSMTKPAADFINRAAEGQA